MNENELLVAIYNMRSDINYHKAEILRRQTAGGSKAMAAATDTVEYAAVQLLISTWNSIAVLMRGARTKDKIYENNPICNMYNALEPAITLLRTKNPDLAVDFEKLNLDYHSWLKKKKKSASYVSAACAGLMNARFG